MKAGTCFFALLIACAFILSPWYLLAAAGWLLLSSWWEGGAA